MPAQYHRNAHMKATATLHNQGQSLWLDNITRDLLDKGTLAGYIAEQSATGLTSNPTIFHHAIKNSTAYEDAIRQKASEGKSGESLFFELALEDLMRAADLFLPIWARTHGVDGWVSLEVSPLLAHDTASTLGGGICDRSWTNDVALIGNGLVHGHDTTSALDRAQCAADA